MAMSNNYDLIFCDIKMPKMDGVEFLDEKIKRNNLPSHYDSGHGNIETAVQALKKGAYDYYRKTIRPKQSFSCCKKCLKTTLS